MFPLIHALQHTTHLLQRTRDSVKYDSLTCSDTAPRRPTKRPEEEKEEEDEEEEEEEEEEDEEEEEEEEAQQRRPSPSPESRAAT